MIKHVKIISAALLAVAITIPFTGCDEGSSAPSPEVSAIMIQASMSQLDSDSAIIDSACKDYYAGVKSGTITSADSKADGAAAPGATTKTRESAADSCTIGNALKYAGESELAIKLGDMSVTAEGTIFRTGNNKYTASTSVTSLSAATTLGTLYKQADSSR